ncbi:MAG: integration host factor subunit alpha [Thermodesulfobacteriota bacterium]
MTLTKSRIIDSVQEETGLPRKRCDELVEDLLEIIKETLANGENLMVSGFGKFCVKDKKARKGRNPATGDDLMLDERKVVTFKCSQGLREKINGN